MNSTLLNSVAYAAGVGMLILVAGASFATGPARYKVVDGIGIYLGIVPTDMILEHPKEHTEIAMHGGARLGRHHHHVMVALFDSESGTRITNARVTAIVEELGLAGRTKELEPMKIAGALTYGNYFDFRVGSVYRILVRVRRPGRAPIIAAQFDYKHHR